MRPQNLFEKIINFLKRLFSTEKQKKMSEGSLKLVQKHDISYTLTRMEEIYNKVLDARKEEAED